MPLPSRGASAAVFVSVLVRTVGQVFESCEDKDEHDGGSSRPDPFLLHCCTVVLHPSGKGQQAGGAARGGAGGGSRQQLQRVLPLLPGRHPSAPAGGRTQQ